MAHGRSFEIQDFAKLAGVTVRALQHYDRLGLLKPARSRAGARLYSEADLQALVQIVVLKSVGVPLKRISSLRAEGPSALLLTLGNQRRALERRQPVLDRIIYSVRNVEAALGRGEEADLALLKPLIAALRQDAEVPTFAAQEASRQESAGSAWEPLRQQWLELLRDIEAAGDTDPRGGLALALAGRWERLMGVSTGGGSFRKLLAEQAEDLAAGSAESVGGGQPFERIGPALAQLVARDQPGSKLGR